MKTGGEDQSYFVNPRVAGSNPASPKGNCSSIGRAAECTVVKRSSPVRKLPVSRRYSREANGLERPISTRRLAGNGGNVCRWRKTRVTSIPPKMHDGKG